MIGSLLLVLRQIDEMTVLDYGAFGSHCFIPPLRIHCKLPSSTRDHTCFPAIKEDRQSPTRCPVIGYETATPAKLRCKYNLYPEHVRNQRCVEYERYKDPNRRNQPAIGIHGMSRNPSLIHRCSHSLIICAAVNASNQG